MKITRIACVGEVMVELIPDGANGARLGVAGDTYNTAVYLARSLPTGVCKTDYVTVLGQDRFSDRIVDHMVSNGVGTEFVQRHSTGPRRLRNAR